MKFERTRAGVDGVPVQTPSFKPRPGRCVFCGQRTRLFEFHHPECSAPYEVESAAAAAEARLNGEHHLASLRDDIATRRGEQLVVDGERHTLWRLDGIGTTLHGKADVDPATSSFTATKWFTILWIPILPLGRYRVIETSRGFVFIGKLPLRSIDWLQPPIWIGLIALLLRAFS